MKVSDIRELSRDELPGKENDLKEEFFNLKFQHKTGQLENSHKLKQARKNVARIKTIIKELEISDQENKLHTGKE